MKGKGTDMKLTDYEAFVLHVRALKQQDPNRTWVDAARLAKAADHDLASRVLDAVGMWPSSEPEIRALQTLAGQ
jgi:hypothetical protein